MPARKHNQLHYWISIYSNLSFQKINKMNTNNNDKTTYLASSDDWESWNLQFQAQAVAGDIWSQIQGLAPFLDKPTQLQT